VTLVPGRGYLLSGMGALAWTNSHPVFGRPGAIAAIYLGCLQGTRLWHLFEVQVRNTDQGVILMNDADLVQLTATEV
jgi:hypothetical protein